MSATAPSQRMNAPRLAPERLSRRRFVRICALSVVGVASVYAAVTGAAYLYLQHEGIHEIRWSHLARPTRWPRIQLTRGDKQLLEAHDFARRGLLREALAFARSGLSKSPANQDGRLLYARLLAIHAPHSARNILIEGVVYHHADPRYVSEVFAFLLQAQDDERVVQLAREFIGRSRAPTGIRQLAAHAAATASLLRGNYDEAEDFLRSVPGATSSREGSLLAVRLDWERGFRFLALLQLRHLSRAHPADPEIYAELIRCLRRSGHADEAHRASISFQIARPDLLAPRIDLLEAYRERGDKQRLTHEIDALLREFPLTPEILARIGDFAVESGDVALAVQIEDLARRHGFPGETFAFLRIESFIVARDYTRALADADQLASEKPAWARDHQPLLDSLRAMAAWGAGDTNASRLYLNNFLQKPGLRAENLLTLADRLETIDPDAPVRGILARAVAADPLDQSALTRLIAHDLNSNRNEELPAHLNRLLAMRRPSPDLLRVAQHKLGSDHFLFAPDRAATLDAIAVVLERHRGALARVTASAPAVP
jgi:hypothetical protein